MYVHIGEEIVVKTSEIIIMLDKKSIDLKEIRNFKKLDQFSSTLPDESVKTVIITKEKVFLSSIASVTLKKRCRLSSFQEFNNDFLTI